MGSAGRASAWGERLALALAAAAALAILGFYGARLAMPLPIYASDEATYLIRAIYPDAMVARDPYVVSIANGMPLSLIRAVYALGGSYIVWDRVANAAAYLGGLALLWRVGARGLPRRDQLWLGLSAVGFAYYRFSFSNMAEGLFVGITALIAVATAALYGRRPLVHAVVVGGLCAALVLTKPHGLAMIAGLGAAMALEAVLSGGWRLLALRALVMGVAFFSVGNLIQLGAEVPVARPLAFFMGDFYQQQLAAQAPPGVGPAGAIALGSMLAGCAVLAGPPLLIGLGDLVRRRRAQGPGFALEGLDLAFLFLALSLAATLPMVTIFTMKISSTASETQRLWGRYFEYFAPLIWLVAGPALWRTAAVRWTGPACAALVVAGLAGLLASFAAGIVIFPWDSSVLTAFFYPDPVRAALPVETPYRALAAGACLVAALAMALRVKPLSAGAGLIVALGVLSTALDHVWVGPLVAARDNLEQELRAIETRLPQQAGATAILAADINVGHLAFLRLGALPRVVLGPPGQASAYDLADVQTLVVAGPQAPPGGDWSRRWRGQEISLFRRNGGP